MTPIETRHLRHFVAVAETGNYQKAAKQVHLSQPAVTKSIQKMEQWFGYKLFDRGAKLELTDFGRVVLEQARKTLIHFEDLQHEANLFRNLHRGELTIGAGPLMAESIVGPAVGRLLARHPALRVTVQVDNFGHFPERLRHRQMDFFVADVTAIRGDAEFEIVEVPSAEAVWFCRPDHPLAERKSVSIEEFFNYPIVLPMMPGWLIAWFNENCPARRDDGAGNFRPALTCSHFSTLKAVVENSDAISGAIPAALVDDFRAGRFVPIALRASALRSNAGIVSLKGRTLSPSAMALIAEIHDQIARLRQSASGWNAKGSRLRRKVIQPRSRSRAVSNGTRPRRRAAAALPQ